MIATIAEPFFLAISVITAIIHVWKPGFRDDLPGPFPIGQVTSFESFLHSKKTFLSQANRWDFF